MSAIRFIIVSVGLCASLCATAATEYGLNYSLTFDAEGLCDVQLSVSQSDGQLKRLRLKTKGQNLYAFSNGLTPDHDGEIVWKVPPAGGRISWKAQLPSSSEDGRARALVTADWAVFRIETVLPPIASVTRPGATARTTMSIEAPHDWPVYSAYPLENGQFRVEDRGRRFDRPDGWIASGDIGIRRDRVAGTRIAVAAPRGINARRLDTMAFLLWHMPRVRRLFPDFPDRLMVTIADDPFFRGGLSAPNSLFIHNTRPLISGNGTSTLLHEVFHVGLSRRGKDDEDWIVEGLAEYYSQQWLFQTGSVSARRHAATLRSLSRWSQEAKTLRTARASGSVTALAVTRFVDLNAEIVGKTGGRASLDDVVVRLSGSESAIGLAEVRAAAAEVMGSEPQSLSDGALRGY